MSSYDAFAPEGTAVRWATWDRAHHEDLVLRWENGAWTVEGRVGRERVHYVLRISPDWQVRQLLLFRDLDEPDLWLATDGAGGWGEVRGATRSDLAGCTDLTLTCTPFPLSIPIRRLPVAVGETARLQVAAVDVETLGITVQSHRFERLGERSWRIHIDDDPAVELEVDGHGLVIDYPFRFRRA